MDTETFSSEDIQERIDSVMNLWNLTEEEAKYYVSSDSVDNQPYVKVESYSRQKVENF